MKRQDIAAQTQADLDTLRRSLGPLPAPLARPALIMVSGLPGTGKSTFARGLAQRLPLAVLESDRLRQALWRLPTHSPEESQRLFALIHLLAEELLRQGYGVLLDATNLQEKNREHLYRIADQAGAKLVIVWTEAPPDVVRERLRHRVTGRSADDRSTADWEVYQRLRPTAERIRRRFFRVDTSRDIRLALDKVEREVRRWVKG
ncbi:MAG: ATP-binding protein [Chloroflexi bacterium]|nr:ATP-binding protein [Chloroflexota bacterium]